MEASQRRELHGAMRRSSGGFDLALTPVLFALLGLWIDRRVGTVPLFTITLTVLAAVGAALKVYYDWKNGMQRAIQERLDQARDAASLSDQLRADTAPAGVSTELFRDGAQR